MPSFPLIRDLPPLVETKGWSWERFKAPVFPSSGFWLGFDPQGNRWITKLRGAFFAYQEIVFARLAQAMKWSCQSSSFIRVDKRSAQILGIKAGEIHAAHWFLKEHVYPPCAAGCAFEFLANKKISSVEDLIGSDGGYLLDWPKSEIAAPLFGSSDGPGQFFTAAHEFVIIDSEQMFSSSPRELEGVSWLNNSDGRPSRAGRALAVEVCRDLVALSESQLQDALRVPDGVAIPRRGLIAPKLNASRKFAWKYIASHPQA